jgi:signal transduction histidine kinase
MKVQAEADNRIKSRHFPWKAYVLTYFILLVLSAGQAMIYTAYMNLESMPPAYIFGMLGYWAIVSGIFTLVTHFQTRKRFDAPLRRLGQAAREVAGGDFSVYVEPIHTADKYDYMDTMFVDFNKMVQELGSIETLKNDFIANVSHEIKTPLSVIQSYASAMKSDELTPEQRRDYADTIITASKSLTQLVTNILNLSKLENQEIPHSFESYDLCRQLSDCALAFEDRWEEKGIEFVANIEDRAIIHADKGMMEIVWHNLLSNAIKFTSTGGSITLTQESNENMVTVVITDTGCGMDAATLPHIFDKFYQADSSHSKEGNGLGLALALRVIELVGASLTVQSEPEKGSTFTVRLSVA